MSKTNFDTYSGFVKSSPEQKHYWTVEIEGLDWTRERKIWNFESAKAVYEQEKRFAKAQGRRIDMFYTSPDGTIGMVIKYSNSK